MAPLDQFILFGDSLTQGAYDQSKGFALGAELQHAYVRRLDVIDRGFSGYTTEHAVEVLTNVLPTPEQASIKFVVIWFGANDANTVEEQNQFVPIPRFKSNLKTIITHPFLKAHSPPPNIILFTNPPFEETVLKKWRDDWGYTGDVRKAQDAAEYAEATKEVARETGVAVLDVWGLFMEKAGWKVGDKVLPGSSEAGKSDVLADLLYDGLHLSPSGYKVVFDGLIELMKEKWPEYPPYKMPFAQKVAWEVELGDQFWDVKNDA